MDDAAPDEDAKLMLAYAAGDATAFEHLYARHRGPLYRFILYRLGDRAATDDVFQEAWSRVIDARHRYRAEARFSTWLNRIAHNLIVDQHRRRRPEIGGEPGANILESIASGGDDEPLHTLSEFEERRHLKRALEDLPDEQRTVFVLRLEQELGLGAIAKITGAGRETVKSRLRYALKRLRERLSP